MDWIDPPLTTLQEGGIMAKKEARIYSTEGMGEVVWVCTSVTCEAKKEKTRRFGLLQLIKLNECIKKSHEDENSPCEILVEI
jgi:hypothetical protein